MAGTSSSAYRPIEAPRQPSTPSLDPRTGDLGTVWGLMGLEALQKGWDEYVCSPDWKLNVTCL